jgi:hypothetical protein
MARLKAASISVTWKGPDGADRQAAGRNSRVARQEGLRLALLGEKPRGDGQKLPAGVAELAASARLTNSSTPYSSSSAPTCAVKVGWLMLKAPRRH